VDLVEHADAEELRHQDIHQVAPVRTRIERSIDVQDGRAVPYERRGKQERAGEQAHQPAERGFVAAFASDLQLHQAEPAFERRAEQRVQLRAHAAHGAAHRPENQDDRLLHRLHERRRHAGSA